MNAIGDPSDHLTRFIFELQTTLDGLEVEAALQLLEAAQQHCQVIGTAEAWEMSADTVISRAPVQSALEIIDEDLVDPVCFGRVLAAAQILDDWHAPLAEDFSGEQKIANEDQVIAQTRFERGDRINSNSELGSLIPKRVANWRLLEEADIRRSIEREYATEGPRPGRPGIGHLLANTVLLPTSILASHPNNAKGPERALEVRYIRLPEAQIGSSPGEPLRVLVAPLLEREADVSISLGGGNTYLVQPVELRERVKSAVGQAYEQGANLLLMPEMVLTLAGLEALSQELSKLSAEWAEATSTLPPLSWTLVGVADLKDGQVRNYVAILDTEGSVVARQHKLSQWNMGPEEQRTYDLVPAGAEPVATLEEAIIPAPEVLVLDLPGLGRIVILICADMNIPDPGDWLFRNAGVDWIYAPIMDRSRAPKRVQSEREDWIVARAHRAASISEARLVVTNSMPLTLIADRTNKERNQGFPAAAECHVGLFLDGRKDHVPHLSVAIGIGTADVFECRVWDENAWEPFWQQ